MVVAAAAAVEEAVATAAVDQAGAAVTVHVVPAVPSSHIGSTHLEAP